jgi:hypothetical protein
MNRRDYAIFQDGRTAAAHGSGLSDSPHGGRDGDLWRQGVQAWLDENDQDGRGRPRPEKHRPQNAPGRAISIRPL